MAAHSTWVIGVMASQSGGSIAIGEIEMRATLGGADQCVVGSAIASSASFTAPASRAFDNNSATEWSTTFFVVSAWIGFTFAAPVSVAELAITSWNDATGYTGAPKDFYVAYSDDGMATPPTIVYQRTGITWSGPNVTQLFAIEAAAGALETPVAKTYVPIGPPLLLSCTKSVMYVITGPDDGTRQRLKVRYVRSHR